MQFIKKYIYVDKKTDNLVMTQGFAILLILFTITCFFWLHISYYEDQRLQKIKVVSKHINFYFEGKDTVKYYVFSDGKTYPQFYTDSADYHNLKAGQSYYFLVNSLNTAEKLK